MSAYLCDQDTINAIATYATAHGLVADAKLFAELLTLQNVASMQARYSGREWMQAEVIEPARAYVYEPVEASAAKVAELADEYDYQACETDDYKLTLCARLVARILNHASDLAALERKGGVGAARLAIIWTAKSSNAKTGPIPVSTTSSETCSPTCPFLGNGCYAESGPLAFLWRGLDKAGPNASWRSGVATVKSTDWNGLCKNVAALPDGQLWRHNQAGDLPHTSGMISDTLLEKLVNANRGKRGFTYTHHEVTYTKHNRALVQWANANGFTINLSGNNLKHADQLAKLAIGPVVAVLPSTVAGPEKIQTPAGRTVRVCPATYSDKVSCKTCQWCAIADRDWIVGFPSHGARKNAVDRLTKA